MVGIGENFCHSIFLLLEKLLILLTAHSSRLGYSSTALAISLKRKKALQKYEYGNKWKLYDYLGAAYNAEL